MSMPKILVGCDPELFVQNADGKFVAPYKMIPGNKDKPHPVPHGAVQVDGMAVEFNIDPASTLKEWQTNINEVRNDLAHMIPAGHSLACVPTADFDPDYWNSLPKEALEIGCIPDFNVYTGMENPRPDAQGQFFRSAAGHIHIGWTKDKDTKDVDHLADCIEVAKQMDFYVGVPSLVWDSDPRRRLLYGKAGSVRIKPYGLEYRTPSNTWLNSAATIDFVYKATMAAVTDLFEGIAFRTKFNDNWAKAYIDANKKVTRDTTYNLAQYSIRLRDAGIQTLHDTQPKSIKAKLRSGSWGWP